MEKMTAEEKETRRQIKYWNERILSGQGSREEAERKLDELWNRMKARGFSVKSSNEEK